MPKFIFERSQEQAYDSNATDYWPCNEGTGTAIASYKLPGVRDLAYIGLWYPGGPVYGFNGRGTPDLDGSTNNINGSDICDVGANNFSFSAWIFPDSLSSTKKFLVHKIKDCFPTTTGELGYAIYLDPANDYWTVYIQYGTIVSQYSRAFNSHGLSTGVWSHVAITVDRDAGIAYYYVNGLFVNSDAFSTSTDGISISNSRNFYLGFGGDPTSRYFDGRMTDVWFKYNGVWTAGEVWRIYKNAR